MAQPTPYSPTTNFAQEEANAISGRSTLRNTALDAELAALSTTLSQVLANLSTIQRDDGEIRDGRVKLHTLAADVLTVLTATGTTIGGAWAAATAYTAKTIVIQGGNTYLSLEAHTSGTFSTDLATGKWALLNGVAPADLASTANGLGASTVGVEDAAGNFTGTDLETVLSELATLVANRLNYTHGTSTGTPTAGADATTLTEMVDASAFNTIAEMKAHTATSHTRGYVKGRFSAGDGAHGDFRFDASDLSTEVAADPTEGIYVAPDSDATGASGAWVRLFDGRFNARWWYRAASPNDISVALQDAVDCLVQITFSQPGRLVYIPNRDDTFNTDMPWDWSVQVQVDDRIHVSKREIGFTIYGSPAWIKVTQNITSLLLTGVNEKSRKVNFHNLHVDINGKTLTAIIQRGDSLFCEDHDIEVTDTLGTGAAQYLVKHDNALSTAWGGDSLNHYRAYNLWMSGTNAIAQAMVGANKAVDCKFMNMMVGASCVYGVELISSRGKIQSNTVSGLYAQAGIATNTAMVRMEEAGNTISNNLVEDLHGNDLVDYGVSLAFASGLVRRNTFRISEYGWATGPVDNFDDDNNILENHYEFGMSGTFTGTLTGCATSPTANLTYRIFDKKVTIEIPDLSAVSNATTMTITGLPARITPNATTPWFLVRVQDNGVVQMGLARATAAGALEFRSAINGAVFTATGNKGVAELVAGYAL